jgi:hypothetical protein
MDLRYPLDTKHFKGVMPLDTKAPEPTFDMEWEASCPNGWTRLYDLPDSDHSMGGEDNGIASPDGKKWAFCIRSSGTGTITWSGLPLTHSDDTRTERSDQPAS